MILPVPAELISQMALDLKAHLARRGITEPRYIGIRTGGIWVAQALLKALGSDAPLGTLDVSFYRDDFSQNGLHPQVRPSELPIRPNVVGATLSLKPSERVKLSGPEPLTLELQDLAL